MSDRFYYFFWKFVALGTAIGAVYSISLVGPWAGVAFACGLAFAGFDRIAELHWDRRKFAASMPSKEGR